MESTISPETITLPPLTRQVCLLALGGLTRVRLGLKPKPEAMQALEHLEHLLDSHCYDFSFAQLLECVKDKPDFFILNSGSPKRHLAVVAAQSQALGSK